MPEAQNADVESEPPAAPVKIIEESESPKSEVSWNLKLASKEVNTEFEEFLRNEARSRAKILVIVGLLLGIVATLSICVSDLTKEDEDVKSHQNIKIAVVLVMPAMISMSLLVCLSRRKTLLVELFLPAVNFTFLFVFIILFNAGLFDHSEYIKLLDVAQPVCFLTIAMIMQFATATWQLGFILRSVTIIILFAYIYALRMQC